MSWDEGTLRTPLARAYLACRRELGDALLGMLVAHSMPGAQWDVTVFVVTSDGNAKCEIRPVDGAPIEVFVSGEAALSGRIRSGRERELARAFADGHVFADPRGAIRSLKQIAKHEFGGYRTNGETAAWNEEGADAIRRYRAVYGEDGVAAQLVLYDLLPAVLRIALRDEADCVASTADLFATVRHLAPDVARLAEIVLESRMTPRPQVVELLMRAAQRERRPPALERSADELLEATG